MGRGLGGFAPMNIYIREHKFFFFFFASYHIHTSYILGILGSDGKVVIFSDPRADHPTHESHSVREILITRVCKYLV